VSIVLNDLFDYDGMKIYQDSDKFKFSLDSILLAEFVDNLNVDTMVDFCTGNAPVPLILSTKTKAKIYGFEIQKNIYDLAIKSIDINKLNQQIVVYNDNLKEVSKYLKDECADLVTCNPPYFKYKDIESLINEDKEKAIARHEITMDLNSLIKSAKYVLKNKAPLYMVHRCDRLEEVIDTLNKYGFKVKKLQFIYAGFNKEAIMVLIKATKNGNSGSLKVMPPIDILDLKSYKGIFERVK
jgi:tRNA1(Val) A37 N6-methylase TrmN6